MTYVKKANEKGINVNITFESDGITVVKLYTDRKELTGRCGTSFGKVSKLVNELTNKYTKESYSPHPDADIEAAFPG